MTRPPPLSPATVDRHHFIIFVRSCIADLYCRVHHCRRPPQSCRLRLRQASPISLLSTARVCFGFCLGVVMARFIAHNSAKDGDGGDASNFTISTLSLCVYVRLHAPTTVAIIVCSILAQDRLDSFNVRRAFCHTTFFMCSLTLCRNYSRITNKSKQFVSFTAASLTFLYNSVSL